MKTKRAHLVDGKYAIGDLVDLQTLRALFHQFTRATGFTIGFLDHPGLNVLIAEQWRHICTKFHRSCPASNAFCIRSNRRLLDQLTRPNQVVIESCEHGLVDCATPIIIKGKHIASLATGQLLLERPDVGRFRKQARRYGYDEKEYLAALTEIPVVSREQLRRVTAFLGSLAGVVSEMGYASLQIKEESEKRYRTLFEQAADSIVVYDPETTAILEFNDEACRRLGYRRDEFANFKVTDLQGAETPVEVKRHVRRIMEHGEAVFETTHKAKDGTIRNVEVRPKAIRLGGKIVMQSIWHDITKRKRIEDELKALNEELEIKVADRTRRLRALAAELTHAEHKERRRIAYLLHEDLQQRLAAITYMVQALKDSVRDGPALQTVDQALNGLTEAIEITRDLTTQLSPPVLYQLGFSAALDTLAREMETHSSLSVRITGIRDFRLPSDEIQAFAFDAVRELLLNVAKHSGVKSAEIRIRPAGKKRITVAVCDKGSGMTDKHNQAERFGLFSIRERAEVMGIGFEISSCPGKGMWVALTVPILWQIPLRRRGEAIPTCPKER